MALARALGIRYVWIDALCIVQGDPADWERESKTNGARRPARTRAAVARCALDAGTGETLVIEPAARKRRRTRRLARLVFSRKGC